MSRFAYASLLLLPTLFFSFVFPHSAFACSEISGCPSGQACNLTTGVCEASGGGGGTGGRLLNPLGDTTDLAAFVNKILSFVIKIGAVVVVFMLVYVGFLFVTARGEPAALITARQALLWTVVGALILLGSQAISLGIQATVGAISAGG